MINFAYSLYYFFSYRSSEFELGRICYPMLHHIQAVEKF